MKWEIRFDSTMTPSAKVHHRMSAATHTRRNNQQQAGRVLRGKTTTTTTSQLYEVWGCGREVDELILYEGLDALNDR